MAMNRTITSYEITGRAIGSIFFTLFGTIWIFLGLFAGQRLNGVLITVCCLIPAALLYAAMTLFRSAQRFPLVPEDPAMKRGFNRVNLAQWIAVIAAVLVCNYLHRAEFIPSAITVIVGLHMFPLARIFRYPLHNVTGAALTLWGVVGAIVQPVELMQSTTALGSGIILWVSAAVTLVMAHLAAKSTDAATAV
jgi:hypothetical protein